MFSENDMRASFAAQGREMADQWNRLAAADYLRSCQDWAIRGIGPAPVAPFATEAVIEFEPGFFLRLRPTDRLVSDVKPESFLPVYGTDTDAIGGPIGGPIPGAPGKFYAISSANPQAGDTYLAPGDRKFVYKRPTPFGGFWEAI